MAKLHWESVDRPVEQFSKLGLYFRTPVNIQRQGLFNLNKKSPPDKCIERKEGHRDGVKYLI